MVRLSEVAVRTKLIPNRPIAVGETFSLLCIVEMKGYSIRWVREGIVIGESTKGGRKLMVTVSNVVEEGGGPYQCIVHSGTCSVNASLLVSVGGSHS